jgi:hypothetical protein
VSARPAVAYIDDERRCLLVTGGERRARFVDHRASRQAHVGEEETEDEAELWGFTAVLGVAPNGGDGRRPATRVSIWDGIGAEEEEMMGSRAFYSLSGVCWQST